MENKPVLTPVWFLLTVVFIVCVYDLVLINSRIGEMFTQNPWLIFHLFLWPGITVIEIFVYWFIRKRIRSRRLMWAHLLLSLSAFVILPALLVLTVILAPVTASGNFEDVMRIASRLEQILFWACIVAGNVSFIVLLVKAFSKNAGPVPETAPSGIFDE